MYETLLGRDGFRKGMDLYFARHDGAAVTTDDFVACMADANGRDLGQFKRWYSQAGTPELAVIVGHDADAATATVTVTQSVAPTPGQPDKKTLHIPLALGLLSAAGADDTGFGGDRKPPKLYLHRGDRAADAVPSARVFRPSSLDR